MKPEATTNPVFLDQKGWDLFLVKQERLVVGFVNASRLTKNGTKYLHTAMILNLLPRERLRLNSHLGETKPFRDNH